MARPENRFEEIAGGKVKRLKGRRGGERNKGALPGSLKSKDGARRLLIESHRGDELFRGGLEELQMR